MVIQLLLGFKQSDIPIRVKAHCIEQTTFSEGSLGNQGYLEAFAKMKGTIKNLRNSADAAALFVGHHGSRRCGAGYTGEMIYLFSFIDIFICLFYFST